MPQAPIGSQASNLNAPTPQSARAAPVGNMLAGAPRSAAPTGNALAVPPQAPAADAAGSPYAALLGGAARAPAAAFQGQAAPMPQSQPMAATSSPLAPSPVPIGAASRPASAGAFPDVVSTVAKQVSALNLQPAQIMKAADALDHARQVVRGLLDQPTISSAALKSAADVTKASGKFEAPVVDALMSKLPPASNQPALRSALEQHLQKSTAELVGLHVAALAQGVDLAAANRAGAGQGAN